MKKERKKEKKKKKRKKTNWETVNKEKKIKNQSPRGIIWSAVPLPRFIQFLD